MKIAIIDDSKQYAKNLKTELELEWGAECEMIDAFVERASILEFAPNGYDLILVDYHLFGGLTQVRGISDGDALYGRDGQAGVAIGFQPTEN